MRALMLCVVAASATGCDHSWSLNVEALSAERVADNRVATSVTVGCREKGESCPTVYCVGVEWFAKNQKLDSVSSCTEAPVEGMRALDDDQTAVYAITSSLVLPTDEKLRIRAAVTVASADAKGDGNMGAREIELPIE